MLSLQKSIYLHCRLVLERSLDVELCGLGEVGVVFDEDGVVDVDIHVGSVRDF